MENKLDKKVLKALPYPNLLAYQVTGVKALVKHAKKDSELEAKLVKQYNKENTIVLLNGSLILNNTNCKVKEAVNPTEVMNKFDYLNQTYLNSGLELIVSNEKNLQEINVVLVGTTHLYHNAHYVIEKSANVKITQEFVLKGGSQLNYKLKVTQQENSNLELLFVEYFKNNKTNVTSYEAFLQKDAVNTTNYVNAVSANIVQTTKINLLEDNAYGEVNTIQFGSQNNELAHLIELNHLSKNTTSQINNFAVANDKSTIIIDGVNKIEKGFCKSSASQTTKMVHLTPEAKTIGNPQLIINEYDVKASHALAVGQLEEDAMYYLMSRGLTKKQSTELLIRANVENVLEKITNKALLQRVNKIIKNKLG